MKKNYFFFLLFIIQSKYLYSKPLKYGIEVNVGMTGIPIYDRHGYDYFRLEKMAVKDWSKGRGNYIPLGITYSLGPYLIYKVNPYVGIGTSLRFLSIGYKNIIRMKGKNYSSHSHYYLSIPVSIIRAYITNSFSINLGPEFYIRLLSKTKIIVKGKKYTKDLMIGTKKFIPKFKRFVIGFTFGFDYEFKSIGLILGLELNRTLGGADSIPYQEYTLQNTNQVNNLKSINYGYINFKLGYNISKFIK